jgi:hypothetical protein
VYESEPIIEVHDHQFAVGLGQNDNEQAGVAVGLAGFPADFVQLIEAHGALLGTAGLLFAVHEEAAGIDIAAGIGQGTGDGLTASAEFGGQVAFLAVEAAFGVDVSSLA